MKSQISLFTKGMLMGAADIVPGVSGGTIAFITGIYFTLIGAINAFPVAFIALLRERDLPAFWRSINGNFLVVLLFGIMTSIVMLATLMSALLASHPILVWSVFMGLVISAAFSIFIAEHRLDTKGLAAFAIGLVMAIAVSLLSPTQLEPTTINLLFGGSIAICAMILPGISGSFLLLMMGLYTVVIESISQLDVARLGIFAIGAGLGLLLFSRVIEWSLRVYRGVTMMFLIGVMAGSLHKLWPWKEVVERRLNRSGEWVPFIEQNVLPGTYSAQTGESALLLWSMLCVLLGLILGVLLHKWGIKESHHSSV